MKTIKKIKKELSSARWSNDTLSPLSLDKYYKDLATDSIEDDEIVKSCIMANSFSSSFNNKKIMLFATDKKIVFSSKSHGDGRRYKNKYLDYSNIKKIVLSQDVYMASRIYVNIKLKKYSYKFRIFLFPVKTILLETSDPTSATHFKRYVDRVKNKYSNIK